MFILSILGECYDIHYTSAKKDMALELYIVIHKSQKLEANQVTQQKFIIPYQ